MLLLIDSMTVIVVPAMQIMQSVSLWHPIALFTWLYPFLFFPFQYTNYDYGDFYDYTEESVTETPPVEEAKTEVTPD